MGVSGIGEHHVHDQCEHPYPPAIDEPKEDSAKLIEHDKLLSWENKKARSKLKCLSLKRARIGRAYDHKTQVARMPASRPALPER
jgi:hypothetical protein